MKTQKAFTIIELLVTVAIIAILTAIVMVNFGLARSKSRDAQRLSDVSQIQLALELFFDRCNRYPMAETTSNGVLPRLADTADGCPDGITLGTFISKIPSPPTANDYRYERRDTKVDYILSANLENSNTALSDDIDDNDKPDWVSDDTSCNDSDFYYCVLPR